MKQVRLWIAPRFSVSGFVLAGLILVGPAMVFADDWPQWLGPQRDAIWRETGILEKFPLGGPEVRWRIPIGGGGCFLFLVLTSRN